MIRLSALATALTLLSGARAQLDERWTVTVNGQTVAANADGSFTIPNIAAADAFGLGGPGSAPDFLSDDALRVIATAVIDGVTYYAFTPTFNLPNNETLVIDPATLGFTDIPPISPVAIWVGAAQVLLEVGQTTPLSVLATLSDGSQLDVTSAYTTYRVSNESIAGVDSMGNLEARRAGTTYVTAVNGGAAAVLRIDVVSAFADTTVDGFTLLTDGRPVSGAALSVPVFGGSGGSDSSGHFAIGITAGAASSLQVSATAVVDGVPHRGSSIAVPLVAGGLTDVGLIKLVPLGGSGSLFEAPRYFAIGSSEFGNGSVVVVADFDSDGNLDVGGVYRSTGFPYEYRFGIQRGLGDGTFEALQLGAAAPSGFPSDLAAADFNGDGRIDLAGVIYDSSLLVIALNDGGNFSSVQETSIVYRLYRVHAGDLNADGFQDLVAPGDGVTGILTGRGDGSFDLGFTFLRVTEAVADLDLDGDLDLLQGAPFDFNSPFVSTYLNAGDNTFSYSNSYNLGVQATEVTVGDLNLDGLPDIVGMDAYERYPTVTENTLGVALGLAGGGFAFPTVYQVGGSYGPTFSDLDLDGDADLLLLDNTNTTGGTIKILRNLGAGVLGPPEYYPVLSSSPELIAADVNGDALPDVIVSDSYGVAVVANRGSSLVAPRQILTPSLYPQSGAFLDVDGDGDQDAIAVGQTSTGFAGALSVGLNTNGTFTFGTPRDLNNLIISPPLIADFDSDGSPDVALWTAPDYYEPSELRVRWNDKGEFPTETIVADPSGYYSSGLLVAGDFDGDGRTDVVADSGGLVLFRNLGTRTFAAATVTIDYQGTAALAASDIDGDGDLDLIRVTGFNCKCYAGDIETWFNDGSGGFSLQSTIPWADQILLAIGDADDDGLLDVVAVTYLGPTSIYYGNSAGGFSGPEFLDSPLPPVTRMIEITDVDLNGHADVLAYGESTLSVLLGQGGGVFKEPVAFAIGYLNSYINRPEPRDADGDGDLDILLIHSTGAAILKNLTIP